MPPGVLKLIEELLHPVLCKTVLKMLGIADQLTLVHLPGNAGQTSNALWMLWLPGEDTYGNYLPAGHAVTSLVPFEFAIQTGFDGSFGSVVHGDTITWEGQAYQIDRVNQSQAGAVFKVWAKRVTMRAAA